MILSIDFDAFYCGVEEKYDPQLKSQPFIVYQKNIIATLSYPARALGLKKLDRVSDAKKAHPNIKLVNGESLSKYRKEGKKLWKFIKQKVSGCAVERLGLEEVWIDLSPTMEVCYDILQNYGFFEYTSALSNGEEIRDDILDGLSLCLSPSKTLSGDGDEETDIYCENFNFELPAAVFPPTVGSKLEDLCHDDGYLRAYIAGHLAYQLHELIYLETGYSCSIGVAENKTLAKMVGSLHKPNGVSVLLPGHEVEYLGPIKVSKIPYFGSKSVKQLIESGKFDDAPPTVSAVLSTFKSEKEFCSFFQNCSSTTNMHHLWGLLQGIDNTPVNETPEFPQQISIEDTYRDIPLDTLQKVNLKLTILIESLFQQIIEDIVDHDTGTWLAYPKTMRLEINYRQDSTQSSSIKTPEIFRQLAGIQDKKSSKKLLAENLVKTFFIKFFQAPKNPRRNWAVARLNIKIESIKAIET